MHTPGPWDLIAEAVEDAHGNSIAMIVGGSGHQYDDDGLNAECLANARLIAAAPALLEALELLLEHEGETDVNGVGMVFESPSLESAKIKARAAIAAARGN